MKTQLIELDATQFGVKKSRAKEMESAFIPMINFLKEMETQYNQVVKKSQNEITKEICNEAHSLRLRYVKSRTDVDDVHKTGKREVLLLGRAWDSLKNQYLYVTNQNEETLQKIEKHFEIMEAERVEKLREQREKALEKYEIETEHIQLGEMAKEVWEIYFNGVKSQYEIKIAAEKKAKKERVEKEKAEQRIKKDNERLQKEAEEREGAMEVVIRQEEAKRKTIEDAARKEREASEAKTKKEAEAREKVIQKVREEADAKQRIVEAKAKKEVEAREKVEAELKAKKDAEIKAESDRLAAIEAELSADDKDKFIFVLTALTAIKDKYTFKSEKYKKLQEQVNESIDKIITFSRSKIK